MTRCWRQVVVVLLASGTLWALAPAAYGLSGSASSERGLAASAQYPNSGIMPEPTSSTPAARADVSPSATTQQAAASGSLPFTGFTVAGVALLGLVVLGTGLWLRRPTRDAKPPS